ncbi:MAG: hypothetical protein H6718_09465 [Polyangiaceae bacterium]|nr:hypothetical protein [Myxococcales bacterium]MCB9585615.1 hypothetical protein [Polyangiaceae bacterium]MCB9606370.1 hypothetical protein [Polyangiaceae bacterium]
MSDASDETMEAPEVDGDTPKRRRKKRKRAAAKQGLRRAELDAGGRERPRFLLDFPEDPELERLIEAFELGNYHQVRELAPNLIEHGKSPEVRSAARELRRRIEPDPLLKYLLLATLLLLGALVWYAYARHGAHAH